MQEAPVGRPPGDYVYLGSLHCKHQGDLRRGVCGQSPQRGVALPTQRCGMDSPTLRRALVTQCQQTPGAPELPFLRALLPPNSTCGPAP